jgi:hypothetical protein
MPDEKDQTKIPEEENPTRDTSLHARSRGEEEDVEGAVHDGDTDADKVTKTGGSTSGGPPDARPEDTERRDSPDSGGPGEKGLGSETDATGGEESPRNADPSTRGAT